MRRVRAGTWVWLDQPTYNFTHDALRYALAAALREAGIYTLTEVAGMMDSNTRPGDVVGWTSTQTLVIDVTVTHLLTPTNINDAERAPGCATAADEQRKLDKYAAECRAKNYDLVPFAVDDFGHIGDAGQKFLEQLASRTAISRGSDFILGKVRVYQSAARIGCGFGVSVSHGRCAAG
jgi:hypothetical protein